MPEIPDDLKYSTDHLWVRPVDGTSLVRAGVTDFGHGWLFEAEIDPAALKEQLAGLMDADAYQALAGA